MPQWDKISSSVNLAPVLDAQALEIERTIWQTYDTSVDLVSRSPASLWHRSSSAWCNTRILTIPLIIDLRYPPQNDWIENSSFSSSIYLAALAAPMWLDWEALKMCRTFSFLFTFTFMHYRLMLTYISFAIFAVRLPHSNYTWRLKCILLSHPSDVFPASAWHPGQIADVFVFFNIYNADSTWRNGNARNFLLKRSRSVSKYECVVMRLSCAIFRMILFGEIHASRSRNESIKMIIKPINTVTPEVCCNNFRKSNVPEWEHCQLTCSDCTYLLTLYNAIHWCVLYNSIMFLQNVALDMDGGRFV